MCTYLTEKVDVDGSGKGPDGWFSVTEATVYVDHPVHARYGYTLNIDMLNPGLGPSARIALELTEETALALADAIHLALGRAPAGLASKDKYFSAIRHSDDACHSPRHLTRDVTNTFSRLRTSSPRRRTVGVLRLKALTTQQSLEKTMSMPIIRPGPLPNASSHDSGLRT